MSAMFFGLKLFIQLLYTYTYTYNKEIDDDNDKL